MEPPEMAANDKDLYALLHISPEASDEEIRRAYRQWAQVYHPDKYQDAQVIAYADHLSLLRCLSFFQFLLVFRFVWLSKLISV